MISVIVPVFNRAALIGRCVSSILSQADQDVEVIIVDDASTDESASVSLELSVRDSRVRFVRHEVNQGVCPARNTGVAIAKGEWVLFLDSDDELVPGALRAVQSEIEAAHASIDGIWFRCQRDDGRLSPDPFPAWRLLDYEGHLRFMQLTVNGSTDMMKVCRRATFDHVRYPNNRALESGYHLDFAKRFVSIISETVARFYHQDAPNQLTATLTRLRARDRSFNLDMLEAYRDLFAKHGESLRRLAPSVMDRYLEKATILALNVGYRGLAAKLILKRAWFGKVDFKSVLMFGVGFVSPDLLDWARRTITR